MRKKAIRLSVIILVLTLLLSSVALASMEASQYLSSYGAYISKTGNTVKVHFDVVGTGVMDNIGATEIYLYERSNSYSSWTLVKTYLASDPVYASAMMESNIGFKDDYVSYSGNASYQYMASITVYAEKNGGSDSREIFAG